MFPLMLDLCDMGQSNQMDAYRVEIVDTKGTFFGRSDIFEEKVTFSREKTTFSEKKKRINTYTRVTLGGKCIGLNSKQQTVT